MTRRTIQNSRNIDETVSGLSFDEVHQRIKFIGENDAMKEQIVESILSLPGDEATFALDCCSFICLDRGLHALTVPAATGAEWLIVLDRLRIRDARRIITREIALAWLAHNGYSPVDDQETGKAADSLLKSWGVPGYCDTATFQPDPFSIYPESIKPSQFLEWN